MALDPASSITAAERRRFEATRDASTLQLLFKAARLANERALAQAPAPGGRGAPSVTLRPSHTTLLPHLDFEGVRLTDLAARVGITKQAVGQLVDDLVAMGMVERLADPTDKRAKRIRFSRQGYVGLMQGLGALRDIEESCAAVLGRRRMADLHDILKRLVDVWTNRQG